MTEVIFIDTRTEWMKEEDKLMTCFFRCPLYRSCSSKHGGDCKRLGGTEIPKIRKRK